MGILDFLAGNNSRSEQTKTIDGYVIGCNTGIIYDCQEGKKEYRLPRGTKKLSRKACEKIKNAERLIIPASFEKFIAIHGTDDWGTSLLKNKECKLKRVYFEEGIKDIEIRFFNWEEATFNIPKSVEHLRVRAVATDINGRLEIGENVKLMDDLYASHDLSIKEVEISGSLKEIPSGAFNQCKNIKSVIMHEGVKKAGTNSFKGTNQLEYVEIPESFQGIFDACWENRTGKFRKSGKDYTYIPDQKERENQEKRLVTILIKRNRKKIYF